MHVVSQPVYASGTHPLANQNSLDDLFFLLFVSNFKFFSVVCNEHTIFVPPQLYDAMKLLSLFRSLSFSVRVDLFTSTIFTENAN